MSTLSTVLQNAAQLLLELPEDERMMEARLLLSHTLQRDPSWLYAWPEHEIGKQQEQVYFDLLERRAAGEPIAYIMGEQEFWSLPFRVTPDTLIPRPETELIIEMVLQLVKSAHPISLLDLGTGSGIIAITLANECPSWIISASDRSQNALAVARTNANQLSASHINFIQGDWFEPLEKGSKFHIITSNPPYVAEDDPHLQQGDLRYEPVSALSSGRAGLQDLAQIISQAPLWLHLGGWLLVEHGMEQAAEVRKIFQQAGFCKISSKIDLADLERMTMGCLNP